jgi:Type IV secretion-system coupling protein DNA-binding domain
MEPAKNDITVFAKTNFRNKEVPFGIKTDDRRRHMYLIGKTGMGKTTLMENMVIQDIRNGHGVAFLDPHGDSIQRILDCVPAGRINDVVYFNPADLEYPVAFNILESVDPKYKHLVASGLMGVFTKIWANLWSARMEYILNNTILALLDSPGNTLLGITRMYVDKKYRKKIVDNIKDPMVRAFWVDEFANYNEKYRTEAIAPIQNKVGQFLSSGIIRNIVGQPKSTIDLREIMDNQKILIMDLSKGRVGEDNSALLGAMLVTKIQLAAMSRTDIEEKDRKDFYLYVDEFQNFATDSFATILSEARKYRLNLIVGHQYIAQLEEDKNTKVRDAIFGNVGTIVVFRIGAADAEFMETEFEPLFTPADLVNLPKYQIILKLMINGVASDPFSAITIPPSPDFVTNNSEKVIKVSRERYSNPVAEIEEKISRWMGSEFHQEAAIQVEPDAEKSEMEKTAVVEAPKPVQIENAELANGRPAEESAGGDANREAKTDFEEARLKPSAPPQPQNRPNAQARRPDEQQFRNQQPRRQNKPRPFGRSQRQQNRPNQQNQNFRPQAKKENPVWNTVADLNYQKQNERKQQIAATVQNITADPNPALKFESPMKAESRPPINQNYPNPSTPPPPKTVLKPGDTHKIQT